MIDIFGEKTFVPQAKPEAVKLSEKQEELLVAMNGRAGRLTNEYLPGDERSFTIISWPVPEIGDSIMRSLMKRSRSILWITSFTRRCSRQ